MIKLLKIRQLFDKYFLELGFTSYLFPVTAAGQLRGLYLFMIYLFVAFTEDKFVILRYD